MKLKRIFWNRNEIDTHELIVEHTVDHTTAEKNDISPH